MRTALVLDALEQALWTRRRGGRGDLAGLIYHTTPGRPIYVDRLHRTACRRRVSGSVGTAGDAYDNALAESVIGLFKTELIKPRGPWRTAGQVEIATLEYVDWFNHRRLYEACGHIPPAELETAYYRQNSGLAEAALSQPWSPDSPARFNPCFRRLSQTCGCWRGLVFCLVIVPDQGFSCCAVIHGKGEGLRFDSVRRLPVRDIFRVC